MKKLITKFIILTLLIHTQASCQQKVKGIEGVIEAYTGKDVLVKLEGYDGTEKKVLDSTHLKKGAFKFQIPAKYRGMGSIIIEGQGAIFCVIDGNPIYVKAVAKSNPEEFNKSTEVVKGKQTQMVRDYYESKVGLENKEKALNFQKGIYKESDPFYKQIEKEQKRIAKQAATFKKEIQKAPKSSLAKYFVEVNDYISSIETANQMTPAQAEALEKEFKTIDITDQRLYHTGSLQRLMYRYITTLQPLYTDKMEFQERSKGKISYIFSQLDVKSKYGKQVFEFLLQGFEALGYNLLMDELLAQVDNVEECDMSEKMKQRVKAYKRVVKGAKAPEIRFASTVNGYQSLSEVVKKNELTLIIFWASWCSHCREQIPEFYKLYPQLTTKNIEVLAVSADTDPNKYQTAIKDFKWLNYCDFQKWNSKPFKDYAVYSTPTFFLVDKQMKIHGKYANTVELRNALSI